MNYIRNFNNHNSIINTIPKTTDVLLLGQSTYGTEEFNKIQINIIKSLITYNDYNIILIETDWHILYDINKYIHNNKYININTHINNLPLWLKNDNFIDFINWLKDYNNSSLKKIYLLGIDSCSFIETIQLFYKILKIIDNKLYNTLIVDLHFLNKYRTTKDFINHINNSNKLNKYSIEEYFQDLLIKIQKNKNFYQNSCIDNKLDIIDIISIEIYCNIIINSYENIKNPHTYIRDQQMLLTTMKLKDSIKNSKIIIWGHNNHIGDATATENGGTNLVNNNNWNLGQMCRSMFQNTYIIGFGTYNGSLTASDELNKKYSTHILNLPLKDSIEQYIYMFCKFRNINNCYINLNLCKNISPFNQKKKQRTIGLMYNSNNEINYHYISSILSKQFDLYIFISYTTHLIKTTKKNIININITNLT